MRKYTHIFLVLLLIYLTNAAIIPYPKALANDSIRAEKGVLDLRDFDLKEHGIVKIKGEWELHWNELLDPLSIDSENSVYTEIPHAWIGAIVNNEKKYTGQGYATYSLKILVNEESLSTPKAIYMPLISSASKLWIDGQLMKENGIVGKTKDVVSPATDPGVVIFQPKQEEIEIILQVSNFHERKGGIWKHFSFGEASDLTEMVQKRITKEIFLVGAFTIFGIYHILIYLLRKNDKSALAFGIFCLLITIRTLIVGESILIELIPNFPWSLHRKIEYWTISISLPIFIMFLSYAFPKYINKVVSTIIKVISIVYSLFVLITVPNIFTHTIHLFQLILLVTMFYVIYVFIRALKNRSPGAIIIFSSSIVLGITVTNDILFYNEIIQTGDFTSLGLFIFILGQSFTLGITYANTFKKVESITLTLTDLNNTLEEKVRIRTAELQRSQDELKVANNKLKELSNMDSLTNVPNRRLLEQHYETVWNNAKANKNLLTILMIDVDCFKPYNDTYGHLLGDDILKAVAKNLQQEVKGQNGFLARYGGEEFIIIFEDKSYDEVIAIANKLNQLVVDMKIEHKASSVDDFITISVGVAQSYYREDYERERLIQYADDALYAAKQSGKNTIFFNTKHGIEKVKT